MEEFSQKNDNGEKLLLMICKKIIEVMSLLEENEDEQFVQNALIIIIALLKDYIPDFPKKKGKNVETMSEQDRETINNILKQEISI
jgi:hypothetical protein